MTLYYISFTTIKQSDLRMSSHFSLMIFVVIVCVLQFTVSDNNLDAPASVLTNHRDEKFSENSDENAYLLKELEKHGIDNVDKLLTSTTDLKEELTFVNLYLQGIRAYDQQLWYTCANNIEKAVKDYRLYQKVLTDCRLYCSKGLRISKLSNISSAIHDFSHFAKLLRDADCFRRCKDESLSTHPRLTEQLEDAFEKRVPYQYLQFCYFKLDRLKLAASAAYTYYLVNPDDLENKQNIVYYRDKAMVPNSDFIDLELAPYKEHYIEAMIAYTEQDWKIVIAELEKCLIEYFKEHERCLADCGAKVKTRGTEFSLEVAEDNLFKAAEATASFLVLNSSHTIMKENKVLLKAKLDYTDADFVPDKDVVKYATMQKEMQDLMDFITKNYRWPDEKNVTKEDSEEIPGRTHQDNEPTDDWMTRYEKMGMHIIAKSVDLNREGRFVVDGMLKEEQCEQLLTLTKDLKVESIGSKKFDLKTAQQRLQENLDEVYEASLRLFIRATDIVSQYTLRYAGADMLLYLKDVFIVCWSQPDDPEENHACYTQEDGNCVRFGDMSDVLSPDAYTTVTYLNTADGDFQFLDEYGQVESSFGVKCGRTVGFNTRDRHAVKVPNKPDDQRCAMVIRYSSDQGDNKNDYKATLALLHRVDELRHDIVLKGGRNVMKKFEEEGVKIVKKGDQLKGRERFVADGLASEAQCSTLRNMVQELGKAGDGYSGKTSPHTINEMFAGLPIDQIAQIIGILADEYRHLSDKSIFLSPHTEHEMYQGITMYRASKLTHQGMISTFGLRTFLELSENSRLLVETYFNLTKPLYFDYTHLVCRTAIDDSKINRQDLSHPVHADNCVLQQDGSCTNDFPAYIHRDYSAILYLNEDFEGGEFFFAHSNKTEQVSLRPKCGRLVGFNAGEFHGVRAVKSGQRCALALWFTLNPSYKEMAHIQARKNLKQLEEEQRAEEKAAHEEL